FFARAVEQVRQVPGVTDAALVQATPMSGNSNTSTYVVDGKPLPAPGQEPVTQTNAVTEGFFGTLRIPIIQGRGFSEQDRPETPLVVIINQEFARLEWPNESPIGKRLKAPRDTVWQTVVGVVGNVRQVSLGDPPTPQLYQSLRQAPGLFANV